MRLLTQNIRRVSCADLSAKRFSDASPRGCVIRRFFFAGTFQTELLKCLCFKNRQEVLEISFVLHHVHDIITFSSKFDLECQLRSAGLHVHLPRKAVVSDKTPRSPECAESCLTAINRPREQHRSSTCAPRGCA